MLAGSLWAQGGPAYRASVADAAQTGALRAEGVGLVWAVHVKKGMGSKSLQAWGKELGGPLLSWWRKGEEKSTGEGWGRVRGCWESCQATDRALRLLAALLKRASLKSYAFKKKRTFKSVQRKKKKNPPGCNIYGPVRESQES